MDLSEITTTGENLRRGKHFQDPYSNPKAKIYSVPTKVYKVHVTQFRPIVQRLTGRSSTPSIDKYEPEPEPEFEFKPVPFKCRVVQVKKAYEKDMQQCLEFLRRHAECTIDLDPGLNPISNVTAECLNCLAYCCLFPKDYELDSDTLLQLWMATGLIKNEPIEDIADAYFTAIRRSGDVLSLSREELATGKVWYKVTIASSLAHRIIELSKITLLRVESYDPIPVLSAKIADPCHVTLQYLPTNFEVLGRFTQMRTLLLLRGHRSTIIHRVPYDFFMSLEHLEALDLSGTRLVELPSSIGSARCLRYLDLSETLIRQLPETIDGLQSLQTLKLQNCPRFTALPKGTKKLTRLRHLDLGSLCRLRSMPPGMGALSSLCTLSDFVVGEETGCSIGELKGLNSLRGKLCLSRLENIASPEEAMEANLSHKKGLAKLELRWTDHDIEQEESIRDDDLKIIEHLRPPSNLQDLRILCYGGSSFPSWISDPTLNKLTRITLFKCENCRLLPSLGQLRSLESLTLIELVEVEIIDIRFCRDIDTGDSDHFIAFPRLQKLAIKSLMKLGEWRDDIAKQDFPRLAKLEIKDCPELAALCRLSSLQSLEYLEINRCTKLESLSKNNLPASIKMLVVEDCPSISMRCSMDTREWHKIEHSPSLLVYQRDEGKQGGETSSPRVNSYTHEKEKVLVC